MSLGVRVIVSQSTQRVVVRSPGPQGPAGVGVLGGNLYVSTTGKVYRKNSTTGLYHEEITETIDSIVQTRLDQTGTSSPT